MPSPIRPPRAEPRADGPILSAPPPLPNAAEPAPATPLPTTPPANDDRASVGQLLMAFQSAAAEPRPDDGGDCRLAPVAPASCGAPSLESIMTFWAAAMRC